MKPAAVVACVLLLACGGRDATQPFVSREVVSGRHPDSAGDLEDAFSPVTDDVRPTGGDLPDASDDAGVPDVGMAADPGFASDDAPSGDSDDRAFLLGCERDQRALGEPVR
ncbi:MAG: hypothetical protein M5T61_20870 [Acidimicrobiia bacterium]|nr:hypothetical protein [Acidimicrobiia bacterium]